MKSHRTAWMIAGALAAVACAIFLNDTVGGPAPVSTEQLSERDALVAEMIALLEDDPRARRPETQGVVKTVADYHGIPALRSAEVFYALGLFFHSYGMERLPETEEAYREALRRRPDWSWAHNRLAIVLFEQEKEDDATAEWAEAIRLDPEWNRPFNDMAILYRRGGRNTEALEAVDTALRLDPDNPETIYNYGVILDTIGLRTAAAACYRFALELDPMQAPAYFNLACGFGRRGEALPAALYLRMAIDRNDRFLMDVWIDPDLAPVRFDPMFLKVLLMSFDGEAH